MSDETEEGEETPKKSSKLPLILGVVLALLGGGGGFFLTQSGILGGAQPEETATETPPEPLDPAVSDIAFIPLDTIIVSLGPSAQNQHLRFRAQLETPTQYQADVEGILPRIVDVLNSYLRALRPEDLERTDALIRLRAQMLRRIQIVTGEGRVRDLLVMEFVLN